MPNRATTACRVEGAASRACDSVVAAPAARAQQGEQARSRDIAAALEHLSTNGSRDTVGAVDEPLFQARVELCKFVMQCAANLLLDQTTALAALVLAQRFFQLRRNALSFSQFDMRVIGGACVLISTKSCEVPRTLRSVVNVVHAVANSTDEPLGTGARYADLKMSLINAEQTVLRVLGFDVDVDSPLPFVWSYARDINLSLATANCALHLATDVYFDASALALPAFAVAAASVRIASVVLEDTGAGADKWWYLYDTSDDDVARVAHMLRRVYASTADILEPSKQASG